MALPININELLSGTTVEWERLEFKEGWNPNDILSTVTAFANDINNWGGGYIVVGVRDNDGRPVLPPVGLDENTIDKIQKELLQYCHLLKPNYFPIVEPVDFMGKKIIIIWAPGGQNRPYQCPKDFHSKFKEYQYYIKRYSNKVKASEEELRELFALAGNIPFDDRMNHSAEISDLKLTLIKEFLNDVKSDLYSRASDMDMEQLSKQMNISDGTTEYLKPKNIGLLMFNDNPQKFIPMSQIDLVEFPESSAGDVFLEKIFKGPLHEQIREVLNYLRNSVIKEKVIKIPDKAESLRVFNYPYAALEESLVNAVYHRSYEVREPIEVRINPENITITSYPGPDKSIRESDLDRGIVVARRYRNRRIGDFLKELKLTEGRSTGLPKILKSMENNGSPRPIFETDDERTYFTVVLSINKHFIKSEHEKARDEAQDEAQDEQVVLSETEMKILEVLFEGKKSKSDVVEILGFKSVSGSLKRAFEKLLKNNLIEYTIPDKPKSKNQKYKITHRGKYLLR